MEGYNVALKVDGKTLAGRTQDDLSIEAIIKESQTKDDKGNTNRTVVGHNVSFSVSGLMDMTASQTILSRDEVKALTLKKGEDAVVAIRYEADGGKPYGGNAIITRYSESTAANGDATYGLEFSITGEYKEITATTGE